MSRAPSTSNGHLSCKSFDQISSFSVVIAPMRSVPPSSRMPLSSGILPRSIRWPGCAKRIFIIGNKL